MAVNKRTGDKAVRLERERERERKRKRRAFFQKGKQIMRTTDSSAGVFYSKHESTVRYMREMFDVDYLKREKKRREKKRKRAWVKVSKEKCFHLLPLNFT